MTGYDGTIDGGCAKPVLSAGVVAHVGAVGQTVHAYQNIHCRIAKNAPTPMAQNHGRL